MHLIIKVVSLTNDTRNSAELQTKLYFVTSALHHSITLLLNMQDNGLLENIGDSLQLATRNSKQFVFNTTLVSHFLSYFLPDTI